MHDWVMNSNGILFFLHDLLIKLGYKYIVLISVYTSLANIIPYGIENIKNDKYYGSNDCHNILY